MKSSPDAVGGALGRMVPTGLQADAASETHAYRICGLKVASEIALPSAIPRAGDAPGPADIQIRLARLPQALEGASERGPNWQMAGERILLDVPRLGRYLIDGGRRIDVELAPGAIAGDAAAFVLGASFGILLHQRGALVLHGSAVAREGAAVAICGPSGAGKSTLAAALCHAGCDFVADELCAIGFDAGMKPVVEPDGRRLKLWRDTLDRLGHAARSGAAVREGFEKYFVTPPSVVDAPPRLLAIYVLRESRPPLADGIEPLAAPDAMRMLDYEAYRPALRASLGSRQAAAAQGVDLLRHARVFRLAYPRDFARLEETAARLREHWERLVR